MPQSLHIKIESLGHIARISLDNPKKHNALSEGDIEQFINLLESVENDPEIRVLILTGAGEETFCSGASLKQLSDGNKMGDHFTLLTDKLAAIKIPTICAMNGSAYGGGVELGLCCDFRVGIAGTKLFIPPARFGFSYPVNGIRRYVNRLGINLAKRLLVASEDFTSEQLFDLGYFTHLVTRSEFDLHVQTLASRIANWAPLAVSAMKQICDKTANGRLDEQEAEHLVLQCQQSQDFKEGMAAIKEGRTPAFQGK